MIHFDEVWKRYPRELGSKSGPAVSNISFSLNRGQSLGLIGPNGAGKSTCIKLLMDFIRPDSGTISVLGNSPKKSGIRRLVGYLPETASFPPNLTVMDMLSFTGSTCDMPQQDVRVVAEKWLRYLDLWDHRTRPLRNYSKGMQQRANFAIALINDPQLLILDEPMSGLDPIGRAMISELIQHLKSEGKTIVFCSHILEDVDRLVDHILLLHKGKKLFYGTPTEFLAQENRATMTEAFVRKIQNEEGNV